MKKIVELRPNGAGQYDVYNKDDVLILAAAMAEEFEDMPEQEKVRFKPEKLIELKEAGFTSEDIIEMRKEGIL
jgi:hypothetical protein